VTILEDHRKIKTPNIIPARELVDTLPDDVAVTAPQADAVLGVVEDAQRDALDAAANLAEICGHPLTADMIRSMKP